MRAAFHPSSLYRTAAGGKSTGGKRPPQQPPSRKRKAGKKKKDDSSDSSSDDSSSSSSSSEEEPEEVATKMPLKKRGKMTPQTPKADSGDESSEFEDEFDKDFFKDDDDRTWIMSLTEFDREQIIAERREQQAMNRESWLLSHRQKKERQNAASAAKEKEAKESKRTPSVSLARGSRRDAEKKDSKNAEKRAALEDMEARKVEQQQKRSSVRAEVEEDSDDDDDRKRQEARRDSPRKEPSYSAKPRHRQIPQKETYPRLHRYDLEAVRVSRDRLIAYAHSPFFGEFVQGLYVRVSLGLNANTGLNQYLVCVVLGVKDKQTEYNVECPTTKKSMTLRKHLTVSHAGQRKSYSLQMISNKEFEEREVENWCRNMNKEREKLPNEEELAELKAKLSKKWKEEFTFTPEITEEIVNEKKKEMLGKAGGNLSMTRFELHD